MNEKNFLIVAFIIYVISFIVIQVVLKKKGYKLSLFDSYSYTKYKRELKLFEHLIKQEEVSKSFGKFILYTNIICILTFFLWFMLLFLNAFLDLSFFNTK